MANLDQIMDYVADKMTWKLLSGVTYPIVFGEGATYATFTSNRNEIKNASEVVCLIGSQNATSYGNLTAFNVDGTLSYNDSWTFINDWSTSSAISSAYGNNVQFAVDFNTGTVTGRQPMKKNNGSTMYCHGIYYR